MGKLSIYDLLNSYNQIKESLDEMKTILSTYENLPWTVHEVLEQEIQKYEYTTRQIEEVLRRPRFEVTQNGYSVVEIGSVVDKGEVA